MFLVKKISMLAMGCVVTASTGAVVSYLASSDEPAKLGVKKAESSWTSWNEGYNTDPVAWFDF